MKQTYLINFNLPFRIALGDSSIFIRKEKTDFNLLWFKRNGVVSRHRNRIFSGKEPNPIKEDISKSVVVLPKEETQEKYWVGVEKKSGESFPLGYIDKGVHGESAFKFLYTEIFLYIQYEDDLKRSFDDIINQSFEILNEFIYCYRTITSDIAAYTIRPNDLEYINLFQVETEEEFDILKQKTPDGYIKLRPADLQLSCESFDLRQASVPNYDNKIVSEIKEKIIKKYRFPLWIAILLEAKEQEHSSRNHDLAIVLLQTSFETFVDYRLRELLELKNEPESDIIKRLTDRFLNKLTQQLPRLLNKEIREGIKEYDEWKIYLYKLRNNIVHKGNRGHTEQDVQRAFNAVGFLLNYIDSSILLNLTK